MRNRIKWLLLSAILIVIAFFYAHVDKNYYLYDRNQASGEYLSTGVLLENDVISQQFTAMNDRISGILLRGVVTGVVDKVDVSYQFIECGTNELIGEGVIKGEQFAAGKFYRIDLPEVPAAEGKQYTFILREEGSDETNGISFNIADGNEKNRESELNVKNSMTEGVLVMKIFRRGFDIETFVVLLAFVVYIAGFIKILYKLFS